MPTDKPRIVIYTEQQIIEKLDRGGETYAVQHDRTGI